MVFVLTENTSLYSTMHTADHEKRIDSLPITLYDVYGRFRFAGYRSVLLKHHLPL